MRLVALLVALGVAFVPLGVEAQQARQGTRVPRVGIILSNRPAEPNKDDWSVLAFLEGFRERGWIDGQNITIEWKGGRRTARADTWADTGAGGTSRRRHRGE